MDIFEKIEELATLERAREYETKADKFLFALDTLRSELDMRLPLNFDRTDQLVEHFEIALEATLVASS